MSKEKVNDFSYKKAHMVQSATDLTTSFLSSTFRINVKFDLALNTQKLALAYLE